jgi:hypothetical protein
MGMYRLRFYINVGLRSGMFTTLQDNIFCTIIAHLFLIIIESNYFNSMHIVFEHDVAGLCSCGTGIVLNTLW